MQPLRTRVDLETMAKLPITGASPLHCLVSYPVHSLAYPSVGMQLVYSLAPADWPRFYCVTNYTRMLRAILNKSWLKHPIKHQLYGHLPSLTKAIQVRWTRHAGHCWRSRDELISDVLLWTPTYGRAKAGWPARTYITAAMWGSGM